jgi:predicted membrane channel-forming protein YqfA (hemolysin III family)
MKIIKWIAGFFEDQEGGASSKRIMGYVAMCFLGLIVNGSLNGKPVNDTVLFVVAGIILFSIGAVTTEFFTKFGSKENK